MGERPGKVTAAAVILFTGAVVGLVVVVFVTSVDLGAFSAYPGGEARRQESLLLVGSGIAVAVAAGYVFLGVTLLQGRRWARLATIGLMVFHILSTVVPWELAVVPGAAYDTPSCLSLVLPVAVILLLNSADARHFFAAPPGEAVSETTGQPPTSAT